MKPKQNSLAWYFPALNGVELIMIEKIILGVIGEDEPLITGHSKYYESIRYKEAVKKNRSTKYTNKLKAEQRQRLEKLING